MGRPSNTEEKRLQIVKAFVKIVGKEGYPGASIQKIAEAAKMSPGLIHYHFKTKQEILVETVRWLTGTVMRRIESVANESKKLSLTATIQALLGLGKDASPEAVSAWVVIAAEASRHEDVRKVYKESLVLRVEKIRSELETLFKEKGFSKSEIAEATAGIISLMEGAFLLSQSAPGLLPKGYATKSVERLIQGYLG